MAKTYALSAGREIRVMIVPDRLSDKDADMLAADIARKIKETLEYPGQIKVTVIRQLIAQSSTDEFTPDTGAEKVSEPSSQESSFSEN